MTSISSTSSTSPSAWGQFPGRGSSKISDFTGNAVGFPCTTGVKLPALARKYLPLVAPLREFILRR